MPSVESDALRVHFNSFTERLAANPDADLATIRAMLEELHARSAEPTDVTYAEVNVGECAGIVCTPMKHTARGAVLYLHGGGFVGSSMHTHRKLGGHLARLLGAPVLVLDYRLAPEAPFPAALDDAAAAVEWLVGQGFAPEDIAFAGDSAGGNLVTALAVRLRDQGLPLPPAIVAFSPWLDLRCTGATFETNAASDAFVQRPVAENMATMYLNGTSPTDPLASPIYADLRGLPPIYVAYGDQETLQSDSERFVERARAAGVDVTAELSPGMQHVYVLMVGRAPEADATVANAAAWLATRWGKP
ncbi:alpha/beta hydrolase [Amycolatopsis methanolica]|uniref:alpha/beta hydrolase n=1 Tax=Amycolatopsis methanolica TaxID=1814 RepID=UPI00344934BB